jgi:hypothetical protein
MNRKIALVKLIRNSFLVSNEDKLALLDRVAAMSDADVEELGKFLAAEHGFILENEAGLRESVGVIMEELKNWKPDASKNEAVKEQDKVYIGTGKPIV